MLADTLLLRFCTKVEQLFGPSAVTPNMHMHGHLIDDIKEYGPSHTFWLFAYERFNGILGSYPNNNKSIEIQLMKNFCLDNALLSVSLPNEFSDEFKTCTLFNERLNVPTNPELESLCVLPSRSDKSVLSSFQLESVKNVICKTKDVSISAIHVSSCFRKYKNVEMASVGYSSHLNKLSQNYVHLVEWKVSIFGPPPSHLPEPQYPSISEHTRPVQLNYFAQINCH